MEVQSKALSTSLFPGAGEAHTPGLPRAGARGLNKGLNKARGCLSPGGNKGGEGDGSGRGKGHMSWSTREGKDDGSCRKEK